MNVFNKLKCSCASLFCYFGKGREPSLYLAMGGKPAPSQIEMATAKLPSFPLGTQHEGNPKPLVRAVEAS